MNEPTANNDQSYNAPEEDVDFGQSLVLFLGE